MGDSDFMIDLLLEEGLSSRFGVGLLAQFVWLCISVSFLVPT